MAKKTWLAASGAILSSLAMLTCCLPFAFLAALGATGAGLFFAKYRAVFFILAPVFLGIGFWQQYRAKSCRMGTSRIGAVLLWVATFVVLVVFLFPQWIASLVAGGVR